MFGIVFAIALSVILAVLVCKGVALVTKSAVALSKVVFSLFVAFVIHTQNALVENAWLNFGIWAAICLAVCFLLCRMPRFHFAFQFFCTAVVSYVIVGVLVKAVVKANVPPVLLELAVKAACTVVTVDATVKQMKQAKKLSLLANPIEVNFERLLASVLYAIALYILFAVSAFGAWSVPSGWDVAILIGLLVLAFVADCLLMEKVHGRLKVIHQQEQAAAAAAAAAAPHVYGPSYLSYDSDLYDPDDRPLTFMEQLSKDMVETEEFLMDTDYLDDPDYDD